MDTKPSINTYSLILAQIYSTYGKRDPQTLSPFVGVEVLNTGSSMRLETFFSSLSICYFRKISNKQKFRGKKTLPNPNSSLCSVSMTTHSKTI